jgi:hypothetical protein
MKNKLIPFFVLSIASLSVWEVIYTLDSISGNIYFWLSFLSKISLIYFSFRLISIHRIDNRFVRIVFILFILYELFIIFNGITFEYYELRELFAGNYILWPFLIPLFVFFDKDLSILRELLRWIFYTGLGFLFASAIFPSLIFSRVTAEIFIALSAGCGFLLLNSSFLKNKTVNWVFIIILVSLISLVYLARRNGIVTFMGFIIASYLLNAGNQRVVLYRVMPLLGITLGFVFLYYDSYSMVLVDNLIGRFDVDTRTGLFNMFFDGMRNNMLFGKGMNATYFAPTGGFEIDGVFFPLEEYRRIIENGYLQLLLSGGIVHIILFFLVLAPAAVLGIFRSNNRFAKASGIIVLLWLLDMFIYGLPRLSLHYILVWICAGICYNDLIRLKSDKEIMDKLAF